MKSANRKAMHAKKGTRDLTNNTQARDILIKHAKEQMRMEKDPLRKKFLSNSIKQLQNPGLRKVDRR